jgi:hypothetical protein
MRPKGTGLTREASKAETFKCQKYSKGREEVKAQEEEQQLPSDWQKWRIRLKEFIFNCRIRKVLSAEGSCEHVAHPLGGDRVVDRWCKHTTHRKGKSM